MSTPASRPGVAVVIASYESQETVAGTLAALRAQTFKDFETVLVDSSPSDRVEQIVRSGFPEVRFVRSSTRLLPHAARNVGVSYTNARLIVFTDADVYADPDWLERLTSAAEDGSVVVGVMRCHGSKWFDIGMHLAKYSAWLPGCAGGPTFHTLSANLLIPRALLDEIGGLRDDVHAGDAAVGWWLERRGRPARLEPRAVVEHHHLANWRSFAKERYARGRDDVGARASERQWSRSHALVWALATVFGVRLIRTALFQMVSFSRAGWLGAFIWTLPVFFLNQLAFQVGQTRSLLPLLIWGVWKR